MWFSGNMRRLGNAPPASAANLFHAGSYVCGSPYSATWPSACLKGAPPPIGIEGLARAPMPKRLLVAIVTLVLPGAGFAAAQEPLVEVRLTSGRRFAGAIDAGSTAEQLVVRSG